MIRLSAAWACLGALTVVVIPARAAQVKFTPQFTLTGDTDSNRRLLREPRESEAGTFAGMLSIARLTETGMLALVPRVTINRFSGEDAYDSDDWGVTGAWRHQAERFDADAQVGVSDDSTLATELGETGFVLGNTRRRSTTASLQFRRFLATRHVIETNLAASDIDYAHSEGTGLVGYSYPSVSMTYVYGLSPRIEATLSANSARLDVPAFDFVSNTRGAQLGLRAQLSERFDLELRAGLSETQADGRRDSEQSFHGGVTWHDELSDLTLALSRNVEPSGRGVLVNADDLRLEYSRRLGERLTLRSALRATRREDLAVNRGRTSYEYGAATLELAWKLDESWTLSLAGSSARQEYESIGEAADGRRLGLGVTWQPLQP